MGGSIGGGESEGGKGRGWDAVEKGEREREKIEKYSRMGSNFNIGNNHIFIEEDIFSLSVSSFD